MCSESVSRTANFCSNCGHKLRPNQLERHTINVGVASIEQTTNIESPWYDEVCPIGEGNHPIKINSETGQVVCHWLRVNNPFGRTCHITDAVCTFDKRTP